MTYWSAFDLAGTPLAHNVLSDTRAGAAAQFPTGTKIVQQSGRLDDAAFKAINPATGALVDDLPRARTWALARINGQRAAAGDRVLTPGQSITLAYARKGAEAADYASLTAAVLATLDLTKLRARFPFLSAAAEMRGVPIATVATEVCDGKASSEAAVARIEAKADRAKRAIRAATTTAAILSAASVNWDDA